MRHGQYPHGDVGKCQSTRATWTFGRILSEEVWDCNGVASDPMNTYLATLFLHLECDVYPSRLRHAKLLSSTTSHRLAPALISQYRIINYAKVSSSKFGRRILEEECPARGTGSAQQSRLCVVTKEDWRTSPTGEAVAL